MALLRKIVVGIILAFISLRAYKIWLVFGLYHATYNHWPGPCRILPNIDHGSEDIELIPGDKALITSGLQFLEKTNKNYASVRGRIFLFDFSRPDDGVRQVQIQNFPGLVTADFHGLSVYEDNNSGDIEVYIVNHLASSSVVERFSFDDKTETLYHKETIADPSFKLLNDVTVVGPRQFYVTNFLYTRNVIEFFLTLYWSPLVHYDGSKGHVVSESALLMGNGIAQSRDGKFIYVAHSFDRELQIYERENDGSLKLVQKTTLHFMVDNIFVDPDTGDLWIGGHVGGAYVFAYGADPEVNASPSKIVRVRLREGRVDDVTEVFSDDGRFFSGASVGVYRKGQLLAGTVASKTMLCEVKWI